MKLTRSQLIKLIIEVTSSTEELDKWSMLRSADYEADLADKGTMTKITPDIIINAIKTGRSDPLPLHNINFPYGVRDGHQGQKEWWKWHPDGVGWQPDGPYNDDYDQ